MSNTTIAKILTPNDIGQTGSHQDGITIPKKMVSFLPTLNAAEENPSVNLRGIDVHSQLDMDIRYIYYNKKIHGTGTRNEYRLTRLSSFFSRHDAVAGDTLTIQFNEQQTYWLSIERLLDAQDRIANTGELSVPRRLTQTWAVAHSTDEDSYDENAFQEEGSNTLLISRRYERSRLNRAIAMKLHGRTCRVCGFSFADTYGELASGYIEIHHLDPVSTMGGPRIVDPRVDLAPFCANCHRMAHKRWPPFSPDELRQAIFGAIGSNQ